MLNYVLSSVSHEHPWIGVTFERHSFDSICGFESKATESTRDQSREPIGSPAFLRRKLFEACASFISKFSNEYQVYYF